MLLLLMAVPIFAFYFYVRDTLGIYWRRWLTNRFLESYFSHRQYYELNASAIIDNPDQRIAEDISTFCSALLYFLLIFIGPSCSWSPQPRAVVDLHELVYVLVVYAVSGTLIAIVFFGSRLMRSISSRSGARRISATASCGSATTPNPSPSTGARPRSCTRCGGASARPSRTSSS